MVVEGEGDGEDIDSISVSLSFFSFSFTTSSPSAASAPLVFDSDAAFAPPYDSLLFTAGEGEEEVEEVDGIFPPVFIFDLLPDLGMFDFGIPVLEEERGIPEEEEKEELIKEGRLDLELTEGIPEGRSPEEEEEGVEEV